MITIIVSIVFFGTLVIVCGEALRVALFGKDKDGRDQG